MVCVNWPAGLIHYNISIGGSLSNGESAMCFVDLLDQEGNFIVRKNRNSKLDGLSGTIEVPNASLWWPYLMHTNPGYLYTLQVSIARIDMHEACEMWKKLHILASIGWSLF